MVLYVASTSFATVATLLYVATLAYASVVLAFMFRVEEVWVVATTTHTTRAAIFVFHGSIV